jgi:hypothetical protein
MRACALRRSRAGWPAGAWQQLRSATLAASAVAAGAGALTFVVALGARLFIVGGFFVVLGLRKLVRPRPLGWLIAVAAGLVFVWFVAVPVGYGVFLTHLPSRKEVRDADLGTPKQPVT